MRYRCSRGRAARFGDRLSLLKDFNDAGLARLVDTPGPDVLVKLGVASKFFEGDVPDEYSALADGGRHPIFANSDIDPVTSGLEREGITIL